jgi:hypothetical protein
MDKSEQAIKALTQTFSGLTPQETQEQMQEVLELLNREDLLESMPSLRSPTSFANQLLSPDRNPQLAWLVSQNLQPERLRAAENPVDLVLRLLPSDGHLE